MRELFRANYLNRSDGANAVAAARAFARHDKKRGDDEHSRPRFWGEKFKTWLDKSEADYAVLSAEGFSKSKPALVYCTFDTWIPEYLSEMKVLAYARPHASRFLAAFVQRTKTGGNLLPFDQFVDKLLAVGVLAYGNRFGRWRDTFGERFHLRPFLREELVDGDAVTDFFTQIYEGQPFTIARKLHENTTVSERALSGLHALNVALNEAGVENAARARLSKALRDTLAKADTSGRSTPRLDRATLERIAAQYRADAIRLDAEFFGRPLFAPALDKAVSEGADRPIELSPGAHFTAQEQAHLEGFAARLGPLMKGRDGTQWRAAFNKRIASRNRGEEPTGRIEGPVQDILDEIGALLV